MDTRYWGKTGWKLLHTIAISYGSENNGIPTPIERDNYAIFFNTIKYILPCKYCRNSLEVFTKELPIEKYLKNNKTLNYWLYKIHNKVNGKLRKQGLYPKKNPSFNSVLEIYRDILNDKEKCDICELSSWDFLYCVCFNLPPHNKIDIERKKNYIVFFNYLAKVLPSSKNKIKFQNYLNKNPIEHNIDSRKNLTLWFYNFNCFNNKTEMNYNNVCHKYEKVRSKCEKKGAKKTGVTCRKVNNLLVQNVIQLNPLALKGK